MKRVALFMTSSLHSTPAGTYTPVLVDLVARLSKDFTVTVFTVTPPSGETNQYACGDAEVRVVRVRHDASLFLRAAAFTRAFMDVHRANPFDIVHGFWATPCGLAAVCSGMLSGIPSIVTLQGGEAASLPSIRYGNMSRASTKALTLWVCRRASALTALTQFQANAIAAHGLKRTMTIIPYGASDKFYSAPPYRTPEPRLELLHVADLNAVKDQATLLRAFRLILEKSDARLTIAGRDLTNGRIERLAGELGVETRIRFLGHVHHDRLPSLYFSSDILLHTSLYEAQGVVVAEACAAGCVVCGTRTGLIADLEGSSTVATPPGNPQALADAVMALAQDQDRYRFYRSAARSWAEKHTAAWTAGEFSSLYSKIPNF
jgi:glycosyltransferase involved in cell wall biosynthesis